MSFYGFRGRRYTWASLHGGTWDRWFTLAMIYGGIWNLSYCLAIHDELFGTYYLVLVYDELFGTCRVLHRPSLLPTTLAAS